MQSIKKLHHFLPRFYLRGFTSNDEGQIEQYFLSDNNTVTTHINNAGAEKFLYSIRSEDHDKDDKIENMFAEFENYMAPAIAKIRQTPKSLSPEEKEWVVQFVTFQYLRTPKIITRAGDLSETFVYERLEELAKDPERLKKVHEEAGIKDFSIEELKEFMLKKQDAYKVKFSNNHILGHILKLYGTVFPILFCLNWKVLESPHNHYFVTSDFPVSTLLPTPTGNIIVSGAIGNPLAEIAIPISSNLCLTANRNGNNFFKHVKVSTKIVKWINMRTIACANNFLYAKTFTAEIEELINDCRIMKRDQGLDRKKDERQ